MRIVIVLGISATIGGSGIESCRRIVEWLESADCRRVAELKCMVRLVEWSKEWPWAEHR